MKAINYMEGLKMLNSGKLVTTPNELGGGNLPSGYDEIVFTLANGNWTKAITLPLNPTDNNRVLIRSSATFNAEIDVSNTELPMEKFVIKAGDEFLFRYHSGLQKWSVEGNTIRNLTPNDVGANIPAGPQAVTFYTIADGNWVPEITLPVTATANAYVIIKSKAAYKAAVSGENMLFASTTQITRNDEYVFKYLPDFKHWVVDSAPVRTINAADITLQIPVPTSQRTRVSFSNGNWIEKIKLPEYAGDRDKVSIVSSAAYKTIIDPTNVNSPGVMVLHAGEQYDFFYISENQKWQLMVSPDTVFQSKNLTGGIIPSLERPRTLINIEADEPGKTLTMPEGQQEGSRIILRSSAKGETTVIAGDKRYAVYDGEEVAFKVNPDKQWEKETITIDLLLLYSDKAAHLLGEQVMQNRLIEGFNLTNEALENSGANFRFRMRGLREIEAKAHWKVLGEPLSELRSDPIVQGWRDEVKADGIYYEGTEDGCGLAYLNRQPSAFNMVATGSINCGTTVMRHELGHNMGLSHGGEGQSYHQGYAPVRTIMGGNAIPYYSTPYRYTSDYGIPMGIVDKYDAVRAMNEVSSAVSAFR